jgi:regulator of sigma D
LHIPEEIYDRELEEREEAQFQEYQGIVKLSNILARRNESENTKLGRIYAGKLKDLERAILNLGQIDRQIALREGEIIEGRKNLELVRFKVASNEKIDDQLLTMSHSSLRRNSYSTSRLPL